MRAFSGAEELSFSGTPRNDSRHCLESTSDISAVVIGNFFTRLDLT